MWNYVGISNPTEENSLFGAAKLVKMLILTKSRILDMVLDLTWKEHFHFISGGFGKTTIIFGSRNVDNEKKIF